MWGKRAGGASTSNKVSHWLQSKGDPYDDKWYTTGLYCFALTLLSHRPKLPWFPVDVHVHPKTESRFTALSTLGCPEKRVLLQSRLLARRPVWQQDLRTDHWYSLTEGAMMQPGDEINWCCSCRSVDVNGLIWIDWFFAQLSCGCSCTWEHDLHATEDSSVWQVVRSPWCLLENARTSALVFTCWDLFSTAYCILMRAKQ